MCHQLQKRHKNEIWLCSSVTGGVNKVLQAHSITVVAPCGAFSTALVALISLLTFFLGFAGRERKTGDCTGRVGRHWAGESITLGLAEEIVDGRAE